MATVVAAVVRPVANLNATGSAVTVAATAVVMCGSVVVSAITLTGTVAAMVAATVTAGESASANVAVAAGSGHASGNATETVRHGTPVLAAARLAAGASAVLAARPAGGTSAKATRQRATAAAGVAATGTATRSVYASGTAFAETATTGAATATAITMAAPSGTTGRPTGGSGSHRGASVLMRRTATGGGSGSGSAAGVGTSAMAGSANGGAPTARVVAHTTDRVERRKDLFRVVSFFFLRGADKRRAVGLHAAVRWSWGVSSVGFAFLFFLLFFPLPGLACARQLRAHSDFNLLLVSRRAGWLTPPCSFP